MGLIKKFAHMFSPQSGRNGSGAGVTDAHRPEDTGGVGLAEPGADDRADIASLVGDEPIRVHSPAGADAVLDEGDDDVLVAELNESAAVSDLAPAPASPPAPRNKQELLTELRKNYSEMVDLIRKVDGHLDEQDARSARMLEIAEGIPGALAVVPELRDRMDELNTSIRQLAETVQATGTRSDEFSAAQVDAIREVRTILERSGEVEEGIATSLEEFNTTLVGMNGATSDLSKAMRTIQERQDARDDKLVEALAGSQRWMAWIVGLCAVGVVAAILIAVLK